MDDEKLVNAIWRMADEDTVNRMEDNDLDNEEVDYDELKDFIENKFQKKRGRDAVRRRERGSKMDVDVVKEKDDCQKCQGNGCNECGQAPSGPGGAPGGDGRNDLDPLGGKGKGNPNIICKGCGGKGHIQRQRPSTAESIGKGHSCLGCGGKGHYTRECPSKGTGKQGGVPGNYGGGKAYWDKGGKAKGKDNKGKGKGKWGKGGGKLWSMEDQSWNGPYDGPWNQSGYEWDGAWSQAS